MIYLTNERAIVSKMTEVGNVDLLLTRFFFACLSSPYFTRAWTLQEMVLAAKEEFVCRHAVLPWHKDLGVHLFDKEGESVVIFRREFLNLASRIGGPSPSWEEFGRFYINTTEVMAGRRCLRLHDKLFATYGMLHAVGYYTPPPPDYDQDFLVAWEGFWRHLLVASRSLMYLVYPKFRVEHNFDPDPETAPATAAPSPSWVPPFMYSRDSIPPPEEHPHNAWTWWNWGDSPDYKPVFRECRLLPPTDITTAADIGRLWVVGKRFGEVSTLVSFPG